MSTRATLTVRDAKNGTEAYSVYRHSDGYPDTEHGVFATLPLALSYAWSLPRFEADDFAAAIIAAWKQPARYSYPGARYVTQGGNIRYTTGRDTHGDTAYHYDIWPDGKGRIAVRCFERCRDDAWKPKYRTRYLTAKDQAPMPPAEPVAETV